MSVARPLLKSRPRSLHAYGLGGSIPPQYSYDYGRMLEDW